MGWKAEDMAVMGTEIVKRLSAAYIILFARYQ